MYTPYILLKYQLAVWWHLCCPVLISSDYCEVILRERNTPVLGAAFSEFMWCRFTYWGLDTAEGGGLRKQEIPMGKAPIPKHTHRRLHT